MAAIYPGAVATQLQLVTAQNNTMVTLDLNCGPSDTAIQVDDASALPASGYLTFVDSDEVIYFTSRTGTILNGVTRGADGTAATSHLAGVDLEARWNADYHNILTLEMVAIETTLSAQIGRSTTEVRLPAAGFNGGVPQLTFTSDTDTGIMHQLADQMEFYTGGQTRLYIDSSAISAYKPFLSVNDGAVGTPQYSWSNDPDCGMYRIGTNNFALAAAGVKLIDINGTGVGIGGTPDTKAILALSSTTLGFLPPSMTTTQRNAISSPTEGLVVYNNTTHRLNVYQGSSWREVHLGAETDIVNADVNASAAIAYSKLSLTGAILNADLAGSIAYSKLVLTTSIVNGDVATAAAIAWSKLATGGNYNFMVTSSAGVVTSVGLTGSRAVVTDSNGTPTASSVTTTELGYVSGVTSAIQTQISAISSLGSPLNLADNGGLEIWQRGVTFSNPANNSYTADRWLVATNEASTVTVTREATTKDTGEYAYKVALSGSGASKFWEAVQYIENYKEFSGRTLTVSMRVWSDTASAVKVGISGGGASVLSSYHTGGSGWETLTATTTCTTPCTELLIYVGMLSSGDKKNGNFLFDSVMLSVGSSASAFVPVHPSTDLLRCKRYYHRIAAPGVTLYFAIGQNYSTTQGEAHYLFPVEMRTAPTATVSSAGHFNVQNATAGSLTCTALAANQNKSQACRFDYTVASGLVAGNCTNLMTLSSSGYVEFSADL